jgi:hypothetical protein
MSFPSNVQVVVMSYARSRLHLRPARRIADAAPALLVAAAFALAVLAVNAALGQERAQQAATLFALAWAATLSPREAARARR